MNRRPFAAAVVGGALVLGAGSWALNSVIRGANHPPEPLGFFAITGYVVSRTTYEGRPAVNFTTVEGVPLRVVHHSAMAEALKPGWSMGLYAKRLESRVVEVESLKQFIGQVRPAECLALTNLSDVEDFDGLPSFTPIYTMNEVTGVRKLETGYYEFQAACAKRERLPDGSERSTWEGDKVTVLARPEGVSSIRPDGFTKYPGYYAFRGYKYAFGRFFAVTSTLLED